MWKSDRSPARSPVLGADSPSQIILYFIRLFYQAGGRGQMLPREQNLEAHSSQSVFPPYQQIFWSVSDAFGYQDTYDT